MTQLDLTALPPPRAETMFPGAGPDPVEAEQRDDIPVPADGLTRTLSYLTDLACVVAVAGPLWRLLYSPVLTGIAIVELLAVLTLLRARTGRTPGALISGTVAVADGSDHAPGLKRQLVRTALMVLLHVTVVGPLIVSFLSRDGRDLVDRIAGTAVLDLRSGKSRSGSGNGDEEAEEPLPGGQENPGVPAPSTPGNPWHQGEPPAPAASPLTPRRAASREPTPAAPPGNAQTGPLKPRRAAPPPPTPPPPTPPKPSPAPSSGPVGLPGTVQAWLVVDSGQREKVDSILVVGREPTGTDGERRLVIPDPTNSISRTHLRLGPASGGVWVEDASSTNGTVVRNAAGAIAHLARGRRTLIPLGTTIIMGERTMMIMNGSPR